MLDPETLDSELKELEAVCMESLRIAQQSITLRKVMKPAKFSTAQGDFDLPKGMYIATLLSVTNTDEGHVKHPFPLKEFHPERYQV